MIKYSLGLLLLAGLATAQIRTTTTTTRIIPGQTRTIRLSGGELLTIDSQTLSRLQSQGVDINNLQNLNERQLEDLGITLRTQTVNVGTQTTRTITLRGGQQLTIDVATLNRLQQQGVDINNLQNLSESELEQLGIVLTTRTVGIQDTGVRIIPGQTQTITLRNGQILTIDSATLTRLQQQGVDINNLQNLDETQLEQLGIVITTRTVNVATPQVVRVPTVTRTEGRTEIFAAPRPVAAPLPPPPQPRPIEGRGGIAPRPPPPAPRPPSNEVDEEANPRPEPYSFAYTSETEDGSVTTREESQDENGRVTGFYTIRDADGKQRRVDYVADESGYRATISTNEVGTESRSPADVDMQSSAPTAAELNRQWEEQERNRQLQNGRRNPPPRNGLDFDQRRADGSRGSVQILRPTSTQTLRAQRTELNSEPSFVLVASAAPSEPNPVVEYVVSRSNRQQAAASEFQRQYATKS